MPTTGSKLSETPSEVRKTMSPSSTKVRLQVRLLSSGLIPSTGPRAPSASRMSRLDRMSWEPWVISRTWPVDREYT